MMLKKNSRDLWQLYALLIHAHLVLTQQNAFEYGFEFYEQSSNFEEKTNITSVNNIHFASVILSYVTSYSRLTRVIACQFLSIDLIFAFTVGSAVSATLSKDTGL